MKNKFVSAILMVLMLAVVPAVTAQDFLTIDVVRINGDRGGDTLNVRVTVEAGSEDVRNAQIQGLISGYRYAQYERDLVTDYTRTFNLPAGQKRSFDLNLQVPTYMDMKDVKLRIIVSDENSPNLVTYTYQLSVHGIAEERALEIIDFHISPSTTMEAGRAISTTLRVRNLGNFRLDDVTARVSIPALGISAFETIDEIRPDESVSFEALVLRIPPNALAGEYEVIATIEFDRFHSVRETRRIIVRAPDVPTVPEVKTVITVPESIQLTPGTSSIYPILIENQGTKAQNYVLSVSGVDNWGTSRFDPASVVVVRGGESQTVYLYLTPKAGAEAGDHVFRVRVQSADDTREFSAVATVKEDAARRLDLRTVLEWALVILVIVLIVLGLVLVFTRLRKGGKGDSEDETQTYY
jgi:uncharacterized membrane protein